MGRIAMAGLLMAGWLLGGGCASPVPAGEPGVGRPGPPQSRVDTPGSRPRCPGLAELTALADLRPGQTSVWTAGELRCERQEVPCKLDCVGCCDQPELRTVFALVAGDRARPVIRQHPPLESFCGDRVRARVSRAPPVPEPELSTRTHSEELKAIQAIEDPVERRRAVEAARQRRLQRLRFQRYQREKDGVVIESVCADR